MRDHVPKSKVESHRDRHSTLIFGLLMCLDSHAQGIHTKIHIIKIHFYDDDLKSGRMPIITEVLLSEVATSMEDPGFFCFSIRILILLVAR